MSNLGLKIVRWTAEEDEILRRLYPTTLCRVIREKHLPHRTLKAIMYRTEFLGVAKKLCSRPGRVVYPVITREGVEGKTCKDCQEWKPLHKFGKKHSCVGGVLTRCTTCESRHNRLTYPDAHERGQKRYRIRNAEKLYANAMRQRVRQAGGEVEPISVLELNNLKLFHGGLCAYCKRNPAQTFDHVIPVSRGGRHALENLLPACFRCNHSKKDLTPDEWFASDRPFNPHRSPLEE